MLKQWRDCNTKSESGVFLQKFMIIDKYILMWSSIWNKLVSFTLIWYSVSDSVLLFWVILKRSWNDIFSMSVSFLKSPSSLCRFYRKIPHEKHTKLVFHIKSWFLYFYFLFLYNQHKRWMWAWLNLTRLSNQFSLKNMPLRLFTFIQSTTNVCQICKSQSKQNNMCGSSLWYLWKAGMKMSLLVYSFCFYTDWLLEIYN